MTETKFWQKTLYIPSFNVEASFEYGLQKLKLLIYLFRITWIIWFTFMSQFLNKFSSDI